MDDYDYFRSDFINMWQSKSIVTYVQPNRFAFFDTRSYECTTIETKFTLISSIFVSVGWKINGMTICAFDVFTHCRSWTSKLIRAVYILENMYNSTELFDGSVFVVVAVAITVNVRVGFLLNDGIRYPFQRATFFCLSLGHAFFVLIYFRYFGQ